MNIVATGLSRLWAGVLNPARGLKREGITTTYFYHERKKEFGTNDPDVRVVKAFHAHFLNLLQFRSLLRRVKPVHLDIYCNTGRWKTLVAQSDTAREMGIPMVAVCTGAELLDFEKHTEEQKVAMRTVFPRCAAIVIKELYMEEVIRKHNIAPLSRVHFCSNKITVNPEPTYARAAPVILFVNLFKDFRRVDLIIKSAPAVLKEFPNARFRLVGAGRYPDREKELRELSETLGVSHAISIEPFATDVKPLYAEASLFLLPADIVFCNNALLEAMERGVPPIVADVEGADRIVEQGVSGLRIPQTEQALSEAIISLLSNPQWREKLARGARAKIEADFSEEARTRFLLNLYRTVVWKNR